MESLTLGEITPISSHSSTNFSTAWRVAVIVQCSWHSIVDKDRAGGLPILMK